MITPIIVPMTVSASRVELPVRVSASRVSIPMSMGVSFQFIEGEWYDGETEVESHLYDPIILETKNKVMPDNVTVLPITILDVDNPAGGYTVTIGRF